MNQLSFLPPDPETDRRLPREPIARAALIDGNYRRWLKRKWGAGPMVGWGMLNPSDASGKIDDPTLWRIMGFSYRWGYGGLVVGNIYPFISANPQACRRWRQSIDEDTSAREAFIRNHEDCAALFGDCALVMAAWGAGADRDDVDRWLEAVGADRDWHCIGTTADGSPKHPLARGVHRVPDDARPQVWRRA